MLNDLPFDYYINAMLDNLHLWVSEKIDPKIIKPLLKNENYEIVKDKYGHALDGIKRALLLNIL